MGAVAAPLIVASDMAPRLRNEQNLAVARVVLNMSQCVPVPFKRVGCGNVRVQGAVVDELDELGIIDAENVFRPLREARATALNPAVVATFLDRD